MHTFLITLLMLAGTINAPMSTLKVEITNVRKDAGTIRVALYKPTDKFGTAKPDYFKVVPVTQAISYSTEFELPQGDYAIAVYHDLNDNGKLDKNLVGYPKEPFGFSNNFRPILSAPSFKDCAFQLSQPAKTISINLID